MLTALPPGTRGIVVELEVGFAKKARGLLTATGTAVAPTMDSLAEDDDLEALATAVIRDSEQDVVAEVAIGDLGTEIRLELSSSNHGPRFTHAPGEAPK